ncbi:MAG: NAD(P)H-binding protein [Anaerolineales bacterium]
MILVTGATGFIGRSLLRNLESSGEAVRILLRPKPDSPALPRGSSFEIALASMSDRRGLRAAMVGVDTVVHLASAEAQGGQGDLDAVDVRGTEFIAEAASDAKVERIFYLSHLGASPSSAFPLLRAKALAEEHIRRSGVPHIILRSGLVFGEADRFLTSLAMLLAASPLLFPIPGNGDVLVHPLWIGDLVTGVDWLLHDPEFRGGTFEIGGPEHFHFHDVVTTVMETCGSKRILTPLRPPYLRGLTWLLERMLPRPPVNTNTIDYLAMNRTAPLDSMARLIGLQPARLTDHIEFLRGGHWLSRLLASQRGRTDGHG